MINNQNIRKNLESEKREKRKSIELLEMEQWVPDMQTGGQRQCYCIYIPLYIYIYNINTYTITRER